jgi:hypothetical protein
MFEEILRLIAELRPKPPRAVSVSAAEFADRLSTTA